VNVEYSCTNCKTGHQFLEHEIPRAHSDRPVLLVKCECGWMTPLDATGVRGKAFSFDPPKFSWNPFFLGLSIGVGVIGFIHLITHLAG
jgi:hypothetical protein